MIALYRAAQVRELDRRAIYEFGIPGITLMKRAGKAAFRVMSESWPQARHIAVVCGLGNNAGDGYVIARLARHAELKVQVFQVGNPGRLQGDALIAYQALLESGLTPAPFLPGCLEDADLIVDALLGTGLTGEVRAPFRAAIEEINDCRVPILAVDLPSGLCADSGQPLGITVRARRTVTFIGRKLGLFTGEGPEYAGEISFDDLEVPPEVYEAVPAAAHCLDAPSFIRQWLPPRRRTAHKGDFGHVLVIGGAPGYAGAARLAAEAALRVGAGLVSLATHPSHAAFIAANRPEIMAHGVASGAELAPLLSRATAIVIGPGLGLLPWSLDLWKTARQTQIPTVFDADALNLLSANPPLGALDIIAEGIYTPHPGEAGRLLGCSPTTIQQERCVALDGLIRRYGGTWVLKGAGTLVGHQVGVPPGICPVANPGMASGGMGDVLAGIIGGLIAQRIPPAAAAALGVCIHAAAGIAASRDGERGLIASDLFPLIRRFASGI